MAFLPLDLLNALLVVMKFAFCGVFGTAQRGSNQVVHLAMSRKWIEIGSRDDERMRGSTVRLNFNQYFKKDHSWFYSECETKIV